ncbi:uncharacterized protein G2W53_012776 [Senna tora]|uniref:Uncharacterized protein n=1 Tax=Senna tora TaxID=362788 RepID=A0A834TXB6_9FABA|nr:uncharacterized protein G2W53_012776 [Senna tora]
MDDSHSCLSVLLDPSTASAYSLVGFWVVLFRPWLTRSAILSLLALRHLGYRNAIFRCVTFLTNSKNNSRDFATFIESESENGGASYVALGCWRGT